MNGGPPRFEQITGIFNALQYHFPYGIITYYKVPK